MSTLVRGTLILTLATIISKILGFIYVVPFTVLVGTQGYILFEYAYKPYVIILSFATLGVPLAVSKVVSKYNELGDYAIGQRLFKSGLLFLTLTGTICFLSLYFLAPSIAAILVDPSDLTGNSFEDVVFVIRMVSFALIVVPPMAIARGFFQGHQSMAPTAVSQVTEQLIRILFILAGSYVVIHVFGKTPSYAVGLATFAAFIGAIGGSVVLIWFWRRSRGLFEQQAAESTSVAFVSLSSMYKELISYAIPFVLVSLAIPLYQTIDTFTINQAMMSTGANQLKAETVNAVVALVQKIILIPVSFATALGLTLVPTITKSYVANDLNLLKNQLSKTFVLTCFLTLPCVALLMCLAHPTYSFLFGPEHAEIGSDLMLWSAPTAIILSLYLVTNAVLQGMDRHKFVVFSLFSGFVVKVATTYLFVRLFEGEGSVLSTNIGFMISITLNIWALKRYSGFRFASIVGPISSSAGLVLLMSGVVLGLDALINKQIHMAFPNHYLGTGMRLLIGGVLGFIVYIGLSLRLGLLSTALGESITVKIYAKLPFVRNR